MLEEETLLTVVLDTSVLVSGVGNGGQASRLRPGGLARDAVGHGADTVHAVSVAARVCWGRVGCQ